MAEYPSLSFADVSSFSGRPLSDYDPVYSATAITQATLLFKMATCLSALPEDSDSYMLATYAILAMADTLILAQPYKAMMAKPVTSETLGSYSYSKMAQQAMSGENTGVMWFDMAVDKLGVCDAQDGAFFFGGIEMMEKDGRFNNGTHGEGNIGFVPESDLDTRVPFTRNPYDVIDDQTSGT